MFTLTDDEQAIVDTARDFATECLTPNAIEWDQTKHFPVDVLRKAGSLGMGGIYIREDVGGGPDPARRRPHLRATRDR